MRCELCGDYCNSVELQCWHSVCIYCLNEYMESAIKAQVVSIPCPISQDCCFLTTDIISSVVDDEMYEKYKKIGLNAIYMCPIDGYICDSEYDRNFWCRYCRNLYCKNCREENCNCHQAICEDKEIMEIFNDIKKCPVCGILITREEGCNSMKCIYCKVKFCWECSLTAEQISEEGHECNNYGQFLETSDEEYYDGYSSGSFIQR